MNHIKKLWDKYHAEAIPANAPLIQIVETRRAFYAGAASLFMTMIEETKQNEMDEEKGTIYLAEINAEIDQFGQDLLGGRV